MKFKLRALSLIAAFAACFASHQVQAIPISGSIAFNGSATFDSTPISGATSFTSLSPAFVAAFQQFGDYSAIPNFTSVAFTPFTFNTPTAPVVPLWTLTIGSITYSFDATTMTSTYDAVHNVWDIGGSGVAHITGFDDTTGTWNLSAGAQGASFFFGSASAVPDGTMTISALGFALVGIEGLRRKLRK